MKSLNDKITESLETTERLLFCKALKSYETKEFRKGLKLCNTILSSTKGASHAETISLKGIFLSCTGQHEDGYNLCKQGIAKDLNSYMCWHILGLVERDRRNYASSLACFKTASKRNPENIQILRDLGNLQLQQGDYLGNMDTREKLYNLQSNHIMNTIAYAYGCYLCRLYQKSYDILENAEKVHVTFHSQLSPQELNNLVMFEAELLLHLKKYDKMDEFITKNNDKFLDKENLLKLIATANKNNLKYDIAAEKYLQLLLLMPNNDEYIDKYIEMFQKIESFPSITTSTIASNIGHISATIKSNPNENDNQNDVRKSQKLIYKSLIDNIPDSLLLKQRYMNLVSLSEFEILIDDYLNISLTNNIPQAINTLKQIYENDIDGKIDMIQEKLLDLIDKNVSNTNLLKWCYYYIATHYKLIDCFDQCLSNLNKCLELDNCMHDAIIMMAKIYYLVNNYDCANYVMKYISDMIPSDRYVNSITGKYFFYVNNCEIADRYLQQFSRAGENIDDYMREIQNLWYRIHKATLFYRDKRLFHALYHIRIAECHFDQFTFDRIDFHFYCIRRFALEPHKDLLTHGDNLRNSKFYWRLVIITAKTLIKIYHLVAPIIDQSSTTTTTTTTTTVNNNNNNNNNNNTNNSNSNNVSTSKTTTTTTTTTTTANNVILSGKQKKQERLKKLKELKRDNLTNHSTVNNAVSTNKKTAFCCPKKHTIDTPSKLEQFYSNHSNLPKLTNELNNLALFLQAQHNFNKKFKTQSILFEIYLITKNTEKLFQSYQQMISIQPNHFKLFWYEYRMLKYFVENVDSIAPDIKSTILVYLPISDINENKCNTYISLKLSDYVKKYHQNPWNMITYILVATHMNISSFIEPTAIALFDLISNEPDIFTYTEMTKFRKFVGKHLPNRLETLDRIISEWYPVIFHSKKSINLLFH